MIHNFKVVGYGCRHFILRWMGLQRQSLSLWVLCPIRGGLFFSSFFCEAIFFFLISGSVGALSTDPGLWELPLSSWHGQSPAGSALVRATPLFLSTCPGSPLPALVLTRDSAREPCMHLALLLQNSCLWCRCHDWRWLHLPVCVHGIWGNRRCSNIWNSGVFM